ncbi:MAG: hypothetical protein ACRD0P_24950, partial [Stackebrandtia sp.]
WYSGMEPLEPFAIDAADRMSPCEFDLVAKRLRERLRGLPDEPAIPYRYQDRGDYDAGLELRSPLSPGQSGLSIHSDYSLPGGDLGEYRSD